MDGGGRLDQPLTRSRPVGDSVGPMLESRCSAMPASGRRGLRARLPAFPRIAARRLAAGVACRRSLAEPALAGPDRAPAAAARRRYRRVAGAARIGAGLRRDQGPAPAGGHRLGQGCARRGRQLARLSHRRGFAVGREGSQPRGDSDDRRRDRPSFAVVPRRRCGTRPADGESMDRRRGGTQALSGSAADQHYRTARLRACGRRTAAIRSSPPTARCSNRMSSAVTSSCRLWSAKTPSIKPRTFWMFSCAIRRSPRGCARRSWWRSGAGTCC